jgi:hypothetical protein
MTEQKNEYTVKYVRDSFQLKDRHHGNDRAEKRFFTAI